MILMSVFNCSIDTVLDYLRRLFVDLHINFDGFDCKKWVTGNNLIEKMKKGNW